MASKKVSRKKAPKKSTKKKESPKKTVKKKVALKKVIIKKSLKKKTVGKKQKVRIARNKMKILNGIINADCKCKQKRPNGKFFCFRLFQGRWVQASGIPFPTQELCEEINCG